VAGAVVVSRRAGVALGVALIVGIVVALVLAFGDRGESQAVMPTGDDGVAVRTLLRPTSVLFGDPLTARVDVVVDRERLDPEAIDLDTQFAPFVVQKQRRERSDFDRFTRLRYVFELDCLEAACVPDTFEKPIQFPQTIVRVDGAEVAERDWPLFLITARVRETGAAAANAREWRAAPIVRAASYRVGPPLLTAILVGFALALLAGATVALAVGLRGMSLKRRRRLTALERALAVLEQAHASGIAEEQRLALDRLADELRTTGAGELAVSARRLAWAEQTPAAERTAALSDGVRDLLDGGRNGRP
jgi:hypothetical protein